MAIALISLLVFFDQFSKIWINSTHSSIIVHNFGWIGSSFSQSLIIFRIGLLVGYYSAILMLLVFFWSRIKIATIHLQLPLYLFFSGITGNFIDRIYLGSVIDFIPIHVFQFKIIFNIADIYQWIAILYFFIALALNIEFFHQNERRNRIFANQKLQLRLFYKISFIFICSMISINFLIYISIQSLPNTPAGLISPIILVSICYGFLFESVLLIALLSETNHWLGPIHSFIQYMLVSKRTHTFKLRKHDEFKELEQIAKPEVS